MTFKIGISHMGTTAMWKNAALWILDLANVSNSRVRPHIGLAHSPYGLQSKYITDELDMTSSAIVLLDKKSWAHI